MNKTIVILHREAQQPELPDSFFSGPLADTSKIYFNFAAMSFEQALRQLDELLLDNGWSHLIGYKDGCAVALEYLKRNPTHSILKLVLISPLINADLNHEALLNVLRLPILNVVDSSIEDSTTIKGRNVRTIDIPGASEFPIVPPSVQDTFKQAIQSHLGSL